MVLRNMNKKNETTDKLPGLPIHIGGDILSLITSAMYTSPLSVYREYIQNAADSIAAFSKPEDCKIDIKIGPASMYLSIRDNGLGLSYAQAIEELIPIANSNKHRQTDRGFRGIGRLCGLAFGESVSFLTRTKDTDPVTRVVWNRTDLRKGIDSKLPIEKIISNCVTVDVIKEDTYPTRFFEVQISGISRYAASFILNRDLVSEYIGEICPVPFSEDFPYAKQVLNLFEEDQKPLMLEIVIDNQKIPITRLHGSGTCISGDHLDAFVDFEKITIPSIEGDRNAAIGWIAHSSYLGALLQKPSVRCMRVRVGNVQIGDETVFDHLFSETRFNRWCVSEIHILDPRIVPNARRDYFEPGPHLRNLENQLGVVCRNLERKCRAASKERNEQRQFQSLLDNVNATYELAASKYLTAKAAKELIAETLSEIASLRDKYKKPEWQNGKMDKLDELERKLSGFRASRGQVYFPGIAASEVSIYRNIFQILTETSSSPQAAKDIIDTILSKVKREKN